MLHQGLMMPVPNATAMSVFGMPGLTLGGCTATAHNPTTTDRFTRLPRVSYMASSTVINAVMTLRQNQLWLPGKFDSPGSNAGFYFRVRFSIDDLADYGTTGSRMFIGLRNSAAALTGVDPATLTGIIGVGHNSGDTFLSFYYGGTVAQARDLSPLINHMTVRRASPLELTITYMRVSLAAYYLRCSIMMVTGDNPARPEPPSGDGYHFTVPVDSALIPTGLMTFSAMRQKLTETGTVGIGIHGMESKIFM